MKREPGSRGEYREGFSQKMITAAPGVELLLDIEHAKDIWPKEIAEDKTFLEQVESRRELNRRLDTVLSALPHPDVTLEQAISTGKLKEDQVADLYESLSGLLASDSEYQRVLLYLPFEFLPSVGWKPTSDRFKKAAEDFRTAYMSAWENLLVIHDVRANFVDGDVLEVEKREGDLPRVVKAAHLIPKLVEAGFLTMDEVHTRMDETDDDVLRESIRDALTVIEAGPTPVILNESTSSVILSEPQASEGSQETVESKLARTFSDIETEELGDVTPNRSKWLKQDKKRRAIMELSKDIQQAIESGTLQEFDPETLSVSAQQAFAEGLRQSIEALAHSDKEQGRKLFETYAEHIESLWRSSDSHLRESLTKLFFRLHGLGVVSDEQLSAHGLVMPTLAGPFSENLKAMEVEVDEIKKTVEAIKRDPELSKTIFPVVLVFGSRLKGYGSQESDIDVAVFVKPGVDEHQKAEIRTRLKELFTHDKIDKQIKEFWTKEDELFLRVMDPESFDPSVGESYWTYILFGAVWEGDAQAIADLRTKILPPYFYDDGRMAHGREARGLGIEELERDTLLYRLMHKGYEKFYPSYGGIDSPRADAIDGQSTFWDSGYRQLATKLYASRVFLPKLERKP